MKAANKVGIDAGRGGGDAAVWLSDRYRLVRRIGEGASSEVFLAEDVAAGQSCAAKIYGQGGEAECRRLLLEFGRLTELRHRNVVRVRDLGRGRDGAFAGRPFLVTDFVDGRPLTSLADLRTDQLGVGAFVQAADDLADALAYLHGRGLLHGDLNPANVRLDGEGRAVLLDFGLSGQAGLGSGATGTLGYLAPEALVGERTGLTDLYALGATLYAAWTGAPPFGTGLESVRRAREGQPPAPSALRPGLPAGWDELVLRCLAAAPEQRPSSARELLREIRRLRDPASVALDLQAPQPQGDLLAGVFVGRVVEREALVDTVERLAEGTCPTSVVVVRGGPGSGRRSLIERAVRDCRVAALAGALPDFDVDARGMAAMMAELGPPASVGLAGSWDEPARAAQGRLGALAETLERRATARPLCVVLSGGADDESLAELLAAGDPSGRLLLLLPSEHSPRWARAQVLVLPPFAPADVLALATRAAGEPPPGVGEALVKAAAGQAGVAALLVRRWASAARAGESFDLDALAAGSDLERQLEGSWRSLAAPVRQVVAAVALATDRTAPAAIAGLDDAAALAAEACALDAGWLRRDGEGRLQLPGVLHRSTVLRGLDADLKGVAVRAAATLPAGDARLGEAHLAAGDPAGAGEAFRSAARAAFEAGRFGEAARAWQRAAALGPLPAEEWLAVASALGGLGQYAEALAAVDRVKDTAPLSRAASAERRAWILGRQGELAGARQALEQAIQPLARDAGREATAARLGLQARLARTFVSLGELDRALEAAREPLAVEGPGRAVAREAAVLALAYGGRVTEAEALLAEPAPANDAPYRARAAFLRGFCQQLGGRPDLAAIAYREAVEAHAALRDLHGSASATFNLGCVLAETGSYGEALEVLERAVRDLGRLGASADLAMALFDAGLLFVQLGDLESAERTVQRTRDEGRARGLPLFDAYAGCLEADLRRRQRTPARALGLYAAAAEAFDGAGSRLLAETTRLARAEAQAEAGQPAEALASWRAIAAPAAAPGPLSEALMLAGARIALAGVAVEDDRRRADDLAALAQSAATAGRRPVVWRASQLAHRLYRRMGDARATAQADLARKTFEEVKMLSPVKFRDGLSADPDAPTGSRDAANPGAISVLVERAARAESRLRRIIRINKRLNSELRLHRVLETIVDTVIELTDAERGFLLLKDPGGELQVKVARNIEQSSLDTPELALSRSIAAQAADRGEPVITVDAAGDDRFRQALSVTDLHLRSVLAVPLAVKGNVVGTIYVDHRLRKGVFDDEDVALVLDFAEQGAIAIENARVLGELRRRERQVDSLNRRLERELQMRHEELSDVRQELKETREAAVLRYDYRQIVGRTPRMVELFRLLDRVTDTSLPVVVQGESGTGKELVARAIHFNGPRRERPFVSENCAAIPETLLESTLFGYVRGAFTGADRDTRGLFAVADGGTLFLDEVAEMSPAMQGKLLRVLQEGEFRRVGGERPQKVDVRVVVATNKDLGRLVSEGKFRQDLFFRLSVVRLTLPPLRERRDDIPLLVQAFLQRFAQQGGVTVKAVAPAAMSKLVGYRWPGNVRELENEIQRAAAFAGARIGVDDLSPHVAAGAEGMTADESSPDSLLLKPRIERLERTLIREALTQNGGNQTRAADALGLSRFGLQKKLRRYGIAS